MDAPVVEQAAFGGFAGEPAADGDEVDAPLGVEGVFAVVDAEGEVVASGVASEEGTEAASAAAGFVEFVAPAFSGVVADAGEVPHVVHGPDDAFSGAEESADAAEGEDALVDPVDEDDVGFPDPGMARDVNAGGGGVDFEEGVAAEAVGDGYGEAVGEECGFSPPCGGDGGYVGVVGEAFGHEHAGVGAFLTEGVEEAAGDDGGAAGGVGFIYDENHAYGFGGFCSLCSQHNR